MSELPFDIVCEDGVDKLVYRDDTDVKLDFSFGLRGGNLADLDRFIYDLPSDAPIKASLQKLRADAVQYFLRCNNHGEMMVFAMQKLETIHAYVRGIRREKALLPLARDGEKSASGRVKGNTNSAASRQEQKQQRETEINAFLDDPATAKYRREKAVELAMKLHLHDHCKGVSENTLKREIGALRRREPRYAREKI